MPLEARDRALLEDIRKAATEASAFVLNVHADEFYQDLKTQKALEREFEIMGEAARGLSVQAREQFPKISFSMMIGMRNILAHNYGRVDPVKLWKTAHDSLPILLAELGPSKISGI
jgi:uncharacterized protein with HEPN domain